MQHLVRVFIVCIGLSVLILVVTTVLLCYRQEECSDNGEENVVFYTREVSSFEGPYKCCPESRVEVSSIDLQ